MRCGFLYSDLSTFSYSPNYFLGPVCNSVLLFYVSSKLMTNDTMRVSGNVISVLIKARAMSV